MMMMMMTFETTHFTKGKSDSKCGNILTPYFTEYLYFIKKKNVPNVWKPFCPQRTLWLLLLLLQDITTMAAAANNVAYTW